MREMLPIAAGVLALISPIIYVRSIIKGKSKPHRTTRFVLSVITMLTFAGLFFSHNSASLWLAGASVIQSSVIFGLSLKYGMGGKERSDIICLVIAAFGIVIWQVTNNPILALYASLTADLVGCVPMLRKTYKHPDTEDWKFYAIDVIAGLCVLGSLTRLGVSTLIYPLYIVFINLAMVVLINRFKLTT